MQISNEQVVKGLVYKTGFQTFKGYLARAIIFKKVKKFKFEKDTKKYLIILFLLSFIGYGITVSTMIENGMSVFYLLMFGLDLITISVPPALPIALSAGMGTF